MDIEAVTCVDNISGTWSCLDALMRSTSLSFDASSSCLSRSSRFFLITC